MKVTRYAGPRSPLVVSRGTRPGVDQARPADGQPCGNFLAQAAAAVALADKLADASFHDQLAASLEHCGWHAWFVSDCLACIEAATSALPKAVPLDPVPEARRTPPQGVPLAQPHPAGTPGVLLSRPAVPAEVLPSVLPDVGVDLGPTRGGAASRGRVLPFGERLGAGLPGAEGFAPASTPPALDVPARGAGGLPELDTAEPDAAAAVWAAFWRAPFGFLTGAAGSGKTYQAREWAATDPGAVICATTGIAAVNLGDAVTVHATLKFFNTASLEDAYINGFLQNRLRKLRRAGCTTFVVDEVSMMEARQLTVLVDAFEELNSEGAVDMGHEPRLQLVLLGDFLQLPPVEGDYAFKSPRWDRFAANVRTLTTIRRQADPVFIEMLRAVRVGDVDAAMPVLESRCLRSSDSQFTGTTILAINAAVDRFNRMRHESLPGNGLRYVAVTTANPLPEWEKNIPPAISLKRGALVVILANKYDQLGDEKHLIYANGDQGILMDGDPAKKVAYVQLNRTGGVVTVDYNVRQNKVPNGRTGGPVEERYDILGEMEYLPLRLGYASTVHKSQGLSLDAVQVDVADPFFRKPSMLYVALSRARTLEGLRIIGNPALLRARCTVAAEVAAWR